jgi:hypothetical protein
MSEPWPRPQILFLWLLFTRALGPFTAFAWPILSTYGLYHPHARDMEALLIVPGEVALPVMTSQLDQFYIILPRSISTATVSVVSHFSGFPEVREQPGAALVLIFLWIACLYSAWYFWIRPVLGHLTNAWSGRET